ncbi:MAG: hypothetical protein JSV22_07340 [Bacteroidales bacterium]|nr:MAG: hypothetical protein JSV22_07340 [Bacteroidales bacterium]
MFLKLFIISVILVAIIMLALGVKMIFNPNAEFMAHSCAFDESKTDSQAICAKCRIKDLAICPENRKDKINNN